MLRMIMMAGLLSAAATLQAAVSATDLAILEADAWRARMGFHLLSIRADNPDDRDALQALLVSGDNRLSRLKGEAEPANQANIAALAKAWQALSQRALDNPLASLGYADYGAMSEINGHTLEVVALTNSSNGRDARYLDIAELSISMQRLASEYLALAAFPSAGLPTGTGLEPLDFAAESRAIDTELKRLSERYENDGEANTVMAFVNQRWAFIRSSVPKMNDQAASKVPYLFYRYATQVADHIEGLVASQ